MGNRVTAPAVRATKVRNGAPPLVMVTAYDAPGARMADEAGVDIILVGDSLAMVVLGYEDTLQVTVEDMAHHTAAVPRSMAPPTMNSTLLDTNSVKSSMRCPRARDSPVEVVWWSRDRNAATMGTRTVLGASPPCATLRVGPPRR